MGDVGDEEDGVEEPQAEKVAEVPAAPVQLSAATASGRGEVKASPKEEQVVEPSMYDDGTYWKTLVCFCSLLCWPRIRSHVKPNRKGEIKASESIIKMSKTEKGSSLA